MNSAEENKKITSEEYYKTVKDSDVLTELRNGEITAMSSPGIEHQTIVSEMFFAISSYIRKNSGKCRAFFAPTDVRLDDNNIVVPDIFVACNPEKFDSQKFNGAPDFVIEVMSGNRSDDLCRKLALYHDAGVREYWIVDPKYKKILVYFFENDTTVNMYGFDQDIPVRIYQDNDEKLVINLSEIMSHV